MTEPDPIDTYLDELLGRLRGDPATVRRILTESEAHLRDAVDAGATPAEAIARYGDPALVAAHQRASGAVPWLTVIGRLAVAACLLVSLGLVAVGVSGVVAAGMDAAFGPRFVAGDLPTISYTGPRCAEYFEYAPGTTSCLAAAARHHTDEVERYRIAAGVAGLVGLGVWFAVRRRHQVGALPAGVVSGIGATAFTVAAVLVGTAAIPILEAGSTAGIGQWLSGAGVAAVFALVFTARLVLDLRRRVPASR
jgi:hypothetical protein